MRWDHLQELWRNGCFRKEWVGITIGHRIGLFSWLQTIHRLQNWYGADMTQPHPYAHPDIRKQSITEMETFIAQKRVRRLILLTSYQQKTSAKLATLKDKELDLFLRNKERADKAMEKVVAAIETLERSIGALSNRHNVIVNIENEETRL